jgi:hypothetical protein
MVELAKEPDGCDAADQFPEGHFRCLELTIPRNASESKSALIAASFSASTPWGYAL